MRRPYDARRVRNAVFLLAILLLSLHWSIREDPCARSAALELTVVNEMREAADVLVTVTDSAGTRVFEASYRLEPGGQASAGPIEVSGGTYHATAQVAGDGWGSADLRVDGCTGAARITLSVDRITIVRSDEP